VNYRVVCASGWHAHTHFKTGDHFCDEPTTGLDPLFSREISELILTYRKHKTSSIIITHDMVCAKLTADRIVILKDGVICAEGQYDTLAINEWVRSFLFNELT
jgi:phospholipid/cholesterol/gamma-HCH transport system ATP-binding protein